MDLSTKLSFTEEISLLTEKVSFAVPDSVKELLDKKEVRERMKKDIGSVAFLDSEKLKFPVYNPENGKIDCKLIYAAFLRANMWASKKKDNDEELFEYYNEIRNKAKDLYKKNKCGDKLKINLKFTDEMTNESSSVDLDLVTFTEMFYIEPKQIIEEKFNLISFIE
jgi:hypothetical protein